MPFCADCLAKLFVSGLESRFLLEYRVFLVCQQLPFMKQGPRTFTTRWPMLLALISVLIGAHGTALALHSVDPHHKAPSHHHPLRRMRRLLWNPLFRPSHDSLLRQNQEVDRLELPRIVDDAQLEELKASHALVPIEESETLKIERSLDPSRRYCRPCKRDNVVDLSEVY